MIREATLSDISTIHHMIVELAVYEKEPDAVIATPADLERALFGDNPALFAHVADDPEHGVIGFTLWFLNYSTWLGKHGVYLEDLYVMPEHRGSGYGIALLSNLAQICVDRGYGRLEWWVLDWNTPARGFYESLGADALTEWIPYRVTGARLTELATASLDKGSH
jgi:GNAT superfamily N-acetyltransferase